VPMTIALPPPEDRSFADVWTALGGELKPSLDLVVTAPLSSGTTLPTGPPVQVPTIVRAESMDGRIRQETARRPVHARIDENPTASTAPTEGKTATRARKRQRNR
jgi:hypothetical protein